MKPFGKNVKMFNISLLSPTKKRTDSLSRMWKSVLDTADNPSQIELVLYVDHDDNETLQFLESNLKDCKVIVSDPDKKEIYSNLHNVCCENASANIVMSAADDIIFRSKSWDTEIIEIFNQIHDNIAYIYPDDGYNGVKLGTHGFFHKDWFKALGYLSPPVFTVDYSDNYTMDVAKGVNRCFYLSACLVEHMHWTIGKSAFDQTFSEAHQRRALTDNKSIYENETTKSMIQNDIEKLNRIIKNV